MLPQIFPTDSLAADAFTPEEQDRPRAWFALFTGLNLSIALCYLACKAPDTLTLSWGSRLIRSIVYLVLACVSGALATWTTLPRDARTHFRPLSLGGARAWVFLPAISIFLHSRSPLGPVLAIAAAALMATYLCRFTEAMPILELAPNHTDQDQEAIRKPLFTTEIQVAPSSWTPFGLALSLYAGLLFLGAGRTILATILLAIATFVGVVQTLATHTKLRQQQRAKPTQRSHPYVLIAASLACSILALTVSASSWHDSLLGLNRSAPPPAPTQSKSPAGSSLSGYRTVVLWPVEKQEKTIPTPPHPSANVSSPGEVKQWVIPFYGPYWYFKFAGDTPGPDARTTQGDPLKVAVHSTDRTPLLMEAHQTLAEPIDMNCCREIQVVLNNDPAQGALAIGITLADSYSPALLPQTLGIKYIASISADSQQGTASIHQQILSFPFPQHTMFKHFDKITVSLLPDPKHLTTGRKAAIQKFILIPN